MDDILIRDVYVHGAVHIAQTAVDALLEVTMDLAALDPEELADPLKDVEESRVRTEEPAPETLGQESSDGDQAQYDQPFVVQEGDLGQSVYGTEVYVEICQTAHDEDTGHDEDDVFQRSKAFFIEEGDARLHPIFELAKLEQAFLKGSQRADIRAEFPAPKNTAEQEKQAEKDRKREEQVDHLDDRG